MHLTDGFMGLVAYVAYFMRTVSTAQPSYDQVRADVLRLLGQSESVMKEGFSREDYDQARFAVCAWVDEALLASPWAHKGQWQREQLQRVYYNTAEAGEEFFSRLNALGLHQRDVREVYYLCLALGFKGRFVHAGDDFLLDQLKASNLKLLLGGAVGLPSLDKGELFPEAYPSQSVDLGPQKQRFRFSPLALILLASPVVLFGLLFVFYKIALNSMIG